MGTCPLALKRHCTSLTQPTAAAAMPAFMQAPPWDTALRIQISSVMALLWLHPDQLSPGAIDPCLFLAFWFYSIALFEGFP